MFLCCNVMQCEWALDPFA